MDKMREEFEVWLDGAGYRIERAGDGYKYDSINIAWNSWKASRAAPCVELPVWTLKNGTDYFDYHKADYVKAICKYAGVSYK